jgi:hypothetical protein
MELTTVTIDKPETINFILGQSHFIKSVEDLHEALVNAVPGIKFGLAFCEASGACLVRWSGNDEAMIALATQNAGGGGRAQFSHLSRRRFYPINVRTPSNRCCARIFCAQPILRRLLSPPAPGRHSWRRGWVQIAGAEDQAASPGVSSSCVTSVISWHRRSFAVLSSGLSRNAPAFTSVHQDIAITYSYLCCLV